MKRVTMVCGMVLFLALVATAACSSRSPEKLCKKYEKLSDTKFAREQMKKCTDGAKAFIEEHGNDAYKTLADCIFEADSKEEAKGCEEKALQVAATEPRDPGAMGRYKAKSQATEAKVLIKQIYNGARSYWMDPPMAADSMVLAAPQFPESVGPTPPLGACCKQGGKCAPEMSQWEHPTWQALRFAIHDPHYYSYAFESTQGEPGATDGSHSFKAIAYGDLDCDGQYSTFVMAGAVDADNPDGPAGTAEIEATDEIE